MLITMKSSRKSLVAILALFLVKMCAIVQAQPDLGTQECINAKTATGDDPEICTRQSGFPPVEPPDVDPRAPDYCDHWYDDHYYDHEHGGYCYEYSVMFNFQTFSYISKSANTLPFHMPACMTRFEEADVAWYFQNSHGTFSSDLSENEGCAPRKVGHLHHVNHHLVKSTPVTVTPVTVTPAPVPANPAPPTDDDDDELPARQEVNGGHDHDYKPCLSAIFSNGYANAEALCWGGAEIDERSIVKIRAIIGGYGHFRCPSGYITYENFDTWYSRVGYRRHDEGIKKFCGGESGPYCFFQKFKVCEGCGMEPYGDCKPFHYKGDYPPDPPYSPPKPPNGDGKCYVGGKYGLDGNSGHLRAGFDGYEYYSGDLCYYGGEYLKPHAEMDLAMSNHGDDYWKNMKVCCKRHDHGGNGGGGGRRLGDDDDYDYDHYDDDYGCSYCTDCAYNQKVHDGCCAYYYFDLHKGNGFRALEIDDEDVDATMKKEENDVANDRELAGYFEHGCEYYYKGQGYSCCKCYHQDHGHFYTCAHPDYSCYDSCSKGPHTPKAP